MTFDPYGEIRMILQDLPISIKGFCYHDDDGKQYIVVNSRLSKDQQEKTLRHETEHLEKDETHDSEYREYEV